MTRDDEVELLTNGDVEILGRVSGSSNQALFVEVTWQGHTANACYKAERGERPLWDFPGGLWRREVAAFELSRALDVDLVPATVARDDLPFGAGSLQWWVADNGEDHYFTLRERNHLHHWFLALGAFDVVANNADRKSGHVVFDNERCWAIDNGLCFHEEDKLRTVVWDFADEPLDPELILRLQSFADGNVGQLGSWLSPIELAMTQARAAELAEYGILPAPDEDREWPPYPWPLV